MKVRESALLNPEKIATDLAKECCNFNCLKGLTINDVLTLRSRYVSLPLKEKFQYLAGYLFPNGISIPSRILIFSRQIVTMVRSKKDRV